MSMLTNSPRGMTLLRLEARKSFALGMKFLQAADKTTPIDLTGATVRMVAAQPSWVGGAAIFTKTADLIDAAGGLSQFSLQAADLDQPAAEYPFTVTLVTSTGYSSTILKGTLEILENPDSNTSAYGAVNPGTNLAAYVESGTVVNVELTTVFGLDPAIGLAHTTATSGVHGVLGSVVGTTDAQVLTNKDLRDVSNLLPIPAGVLSADGTATLTHKTITLDGGANGNVINGFGASTFVMTNALGNLDPAATKAIPAGALVGTTDTQTLTGKTISIAQNTIGGFTASRFIASDASGNLVASSKALPTGAVVGDTDAQTLTNKTLTNPVINETTGWTAYTPALSASTAPTVGNGTLQGWYKKIGRTVFFRILFTVGSTSTFGSGGWDVTLPTTPAAGAYGEAFHGIAFDTSATALFVVRGTVATAGSNQARMYVDAVTAGAQLRPVGASNPMTWAAGDSLSLTGTYESTT